ncbi:MAG: UDP-N-acetylmuramoyl-tripeptide--D-alanyl-D-alanine ligase [Oscillospiraceae bacterium]|nr:UDP-N-acetylmuramoyl-tripeptide--D-alanyl-D-alanine ligase [Oscillospiraceae bacterium]
MEALTLRDLLQAVNGTLLGSFDNLDVTVDSLDTDSRNIHPGSVFLPLSGERFDGHAYINSALEAGAAGCFTARERDSYLPGKFYIKVTNTQRALRDLAAWYLARFSIPVIGVTGSVGKTTTKDMLAAVLGVKYRVLKTEGNFNNKVGLPLTILRLDRSHEICVLEMGMSQAGEIAYLSDIAKPDVAVISNVGDAHIENLGSREGILAAKCEIFTGLKPDGVAILNGDDELLNTIVVGQEIVRCGQSDLCQWRAGQPEQVDGRTVCTAQTPLGQLELDIPAMGAHMIYPSLMAAAVGARFGLTADEILEGIQQFKPTKMRMDVIRRGQDITILNDTYNANPQSMRAAIGILADSKSEFKLAVLGDMFELGSLAPILHREVGECLGRAGIDCLVAVGELSVHIAEAARETGVANVIHCPDKEAAKPVLAEKLRPNTTVLVKASRGMAMEQLVEYLRQITKDN